MPVDTALILYLWGYSNALKLDCHWLKFVISFIVSIFNESEQSTPFAAHCASVLVNTVKSQQTSPSWTNLDKNFVKPEQTICKFCQAGKCFFDFSSGWISGHSWKSSSPRLLKSSFISMAWAILCCAILMQCSCRVDLSWSFNSLQLESCALNDIRWCTMIADATLRLIVSDPQMLFTTGCSLPGVLPLSVFSFSYKGFAFLFSKYCFFCWRLTAA